MIERSVTLARAAGASANRAVIHACIRGERDLKEALAATLPAVGYAGPG